MATNKTKELTEGFKAKLIADIKSCSNAIEVSQVLCVWQSLLDSLGEMSDLQFNIKDKWRSWNKAQEEGDDE